MNVIPANSRHLPQKMDECVSILKKSTNKETCLRTAYDILANKYHGNRLKTLTRLPELFVRDTDTLWKKKGFLHCTNINLLLEVLLMGSGHFHKKDIRRQWTLLWGVSPHQYLRVNVGKGKWLSVDIWAKTYGIAFGDYAHGFHAKS